LAKPELSGTLIYPQDATAGEYA